MVKIKVRKKLTRGDVTRVVLETVKISGLLAAALVAPQAVQAMRKMGIVDFKGKRKAINNARSRLINSGLLKRNEKGYLSLTDRGREKLQDFELKNFELTIPRTWDKKWRMLIFDIPESRRYTRQKVRNTLRAIGFMRLQDSVWVFPYDCSDPITLLKADFKIGKDLLYLTVEEIENDKNVKDYFNLL